MWMFIIGVLSGIFVIILSLVTWQYIDHIRFMNDLNKRIKEQKVNGKSVNVKIKKNCIDLKKTKIYKGTLKDGYIHITGKESGGYQYNFPMNKFHILD